MENQAAFIELPLNPRGRDLVVGDLHGQLPMLDRLLEYAGFDPARDRLLLLGDLIDRGEEGAALIERVNARREWLSLLGNHEAMFVAAAYSAEAAEAWLRNGAQWASGCEARVLDRLRAIAADFPLAAELPLADGRRLGLVHAEVQVGGRWSAMRDLKFDDDAALDDSASTLTSAALWGRQRVVADARARLDPAAVGVRNTLLKVHTWQALQPVAGVDRVVCGHTVLVPPLPRGRGNVLWIDTGAYRAGGRLTMVDVADDRFWQVEHGSGHCRGPLPLPPGDPLPEGWRPTPEESPTAERARDFPAVSPLDF